MIDIWLKVIPMAVGQLGLFVGSLTVGPGPVPDTWLCGTYFLWRDAMPALMQGGGAWP